MWARRCIQMQMLMHVTRQASRRTAAAAARGGATAATAGTATIRSRGASAFSHFHTRTRLRPFDPSSSSSFTRRFTTALLFSTATATTIYCLSDEQTGTTAVFAFGSGAYGQLGLGNENTVMTPTRIASLEGLPIRQIVANSHSSFVLTELGEVYSFGRGQHYNLGHGDTSNVTLPTRVRALSDIQVESIACSETQTAVIDNFGQVYLFGTDMNTYEFPTKICFPAPIASVSCGRHHLLAVTSDGQVYGIGLNKDAAVGVGHRAPVAEPTSIPIAEQIVRTSAGNGFSFFLTEAGTVYSAGTNRYGEIGVGSNVHHVLSPVIIPTLADEQIVDISAGEFHALVLTSNGNVYGFGLGREGQLGIPGNNSVHNTTPLHLSTLPPVQQIVAGFAHSAFIANGELYLCGRGRESQLGLTGHTESVAAYKDVPTRVQYFHENNQTVLQAALGADYTLALVKPRAAK